MGQDVPVTLGDDPNSGTPLAPVFHVRPTEPAEGLAWLTDQLYAPFQIEGGTIGLAGCLFDEIPFLGCGSEHDRRWYDAAGEEVTADFAISLGLNNCQSHERVPRLWRDLEATPAVRALRDQVGLSYKPSELVVAWVRWVHGKLSVNGSKRSVDIPFEGWARHFASGRSRAESFRCPETQAEGDQIVVTSDGEPTVPSQVESCVVSGKIRLKKRLKQCAVTGRWVSPEYLKTCPVSGESLLPDLLQECRSCLLTVSPNVISRRKCLLCRTVNGKPPSPTWLNWLEETLPEAKGWRWELAEGVECGVFIACRWTGQKMVAVVHLAHRSLVRARARTIFGRWTSLKESPI